MSAFGGTIDADLHGLVDGQIESGRRASALRRLAASPADRARVEGWQAQNDLLRSAFAEVDREPVPAILDLRARPQLHCIPANDAPLVAPVTAQSGPKRGRLAALGALVVIAGGLIGSWILLSQTEVDEAPAAPTLREPTDAALARRTVAALGTGTTAARPVADLPTTRIPDLRASGFRFTDAETDSSQPPAILFRYKNESAEQLVVSVARASNTITTPPTRSGRTLSWQAGGKLFTLTGTLDTARLRTIATALQRKGQ